MKIILFTSQDIGPKLVEFFNKKKGYTLFVVTQSTLKDRIYGYRSAEDYCRANSICYVAPKTLDAAFIESVRAFDPDIMISAYYPKIYSKELLLIPRLGAINVHPGDLPKYKGPFSIPWMILNRENKIVVTMHYLSEEIDSGDILAQTESDIDYCETSFELYKRGMHMAADLVINSFDDLIEGKLLPKPQIGFGTYYNRLPPRYQIPWNIKGDEILRQIRVHAKPYLPAYSYVFNRCLYINKASFHIPSSGSANGSGKITRVNDDWSFCVSCCDGEILISDYEIYPPFENQFQKKLELSVGISLE